MWIEGERRADHFYCECVIIVVGSGGSQQRGDIIKRRKAGILYVFFSAEPASLCGVFSINTPEGP
jgi:hypothetical protein